VKAGVLRKGGASEGCFNDYSIRLCVDGVTEDNVLIMQMSVAVWVRRMQRGQNGGNKPSPQSSNGSRLISGSSPSLSFVTNTSIFIHYHDIALPAVECRFQDDTNGDIGLDNLIIILLSIPKQRYMRPTCERPHVLCVTPTLCNAKGDAMPPSIAPEIRKCVVSQGMLLPGKHGNTLIVALAVLMFCCWYGEENLKSRLIYGSDR
jgi:hypothetical protein